MSDLEIPKCDYHYYKISSNEKSKHLSLSQKLFKS